MRLPAACLRGKKSHAKFAKSAKDGTLKTIETRFAGIENRKPQRTQRITKKTSGKRQFLVISHKKFRNPALPGRRGADASI